MGMLMDDEVITLQGREMKIAAPAPVAEEPLPPPTEEQVPIIEAIARGDSLVVNAFAGTGKTTTMEMAARATPSKRITYIAFNRSVANAASLRFPRNVSATTGHALALRGIHPTAKRSFLDLYMSRVQNSPLDIRRALEESMRFDVDSVAGLGIPKMMAVSAIIESVNNFCRSSDQVVTSAHVPYELRLALAGEGSSSVMDSTQEMADLVGKSANKLWERMYDYQSKFPITHDVYLKAWEMTSPMIAADILFFDEAQDGNPVMLSIVEKQKHIQRVLVGDRYQSIYGWRGAKNAMDAFPEFKTLPLTASWRYGQAIADEGQVFLDVYGEKQKLRGLAKHECRVTDDFFDPKDLPRAILCRTNAGLIAQSIMIASHGGEFNVVGGIQPALDMIRAAQAFRHGEKPKKSCPEFRYIATLEHPWEHLVELSKTSDGQQFAPIIAFIEKNSAEGKIDSLVDMLEAKSRNPDPSATILSTGHKAKGMEWESVGLADDFAKKGIITALPPGFEPTMRQMKSGDFRLLEKDRRWIKLNREYINLCYVAVTRAEVSLVGNGALGALKGDIATWNEAVDVLASQGGREPREEDAPVPLAA